MNNAIDKNGTEIEVTLFLLKKHQMNTDKNSKKLKVGDWIIWAGYVCQVIDIEDWLTVIHSVGFESEFKIPTYRLVKESTSITEKEALFLLLKNRKAFVGNF